MDGSQVEAAVHSLTTNMSALINNQNQFRNDINEMKENNQSPNPNYLRGTNGDPHYAYNNDVIANLERRWNEMNNVIFNMAYTLNELLQYMRRNNLLIHNLPGMPYEELKKLKGTAFSKKVAENLNKLIELEEPISHKDIDASHFYKKPTTDSNNVVIVKFIRRDLKNEIFFSKSQLKEYNKGREVKTGITEHLTSYNKGLYDKAKLIAGVRNVWTSKCRIYAKIRGEKIEVKEESDLPCNPQMQHDSTTPPHVQNNSVHGTHSNTGQHSQNTPEHFTTPPYMYPHTGWPSLNTSLMMLNQKRKPNRNNVHRR